MHNRDRASSLEWFAIGACQSQVIAQRLRQRPAVLYFDGNRPAVDVELDGGARRRLDRGFTGGRRRGQSGEGGGRDNPQAGPFDKVSSGNLHMEESYR